MAKNKKKYITKNLLEKLVDYTNQHKGLFFIVGNPETDELLISFMEKNTFLRFPISLDKTNNVLVRMLHQSTFTQGMADFLSGLTKGLELDKKNPNTLRVMNVIGGSVQSMVDLKDK